MSKPLSLLVASLLAAVFTGCHAVPVPTDDSAALDVDIPHNGQPYRNHPDDFQFVIVGDRTGGHRPGVFAQAIEQINWLQPEFAISVGDQIEGYTEDAIELDRQWHAVEAMIDKLDMRFFYVVGNHDISNETMRRDWHERRGRDYYHFIYKNVLFVALNTEDPPTSHQKAARLEALGVDQEQLRNMMRLAATDPARAREEFARNPALLQAVEAIRSADQTTISDRQVDYVRRALQQNPDVRWTIVLMHKPAWRYQSVQFEQIEAMLKDRPHTFFAGHMHSYSYTVHDGHEYIQLGTTGGVMNTDPANGTPLDHVMWVTMTPDGPKIANLALEGIHDRTGPPRQKVASGP